MGGVSPGCLGVGRGASRGRVNPAVGDQRKKKKNGQQSSLHPAAVRTPLLNPANTRLLLLTGIYHQYRARTRNSIATQATGAHSTWRKRKQVSATLRFLALPNSPLPPPMLSHMSHMESFGDGPATLMSLGPSPAAGLPTQSRRQTGRHAKAFSVSTPAYLCPIPIKSNSPLPSASSRRKNKYVQRSQSPLFCDFQRHLQFAIWEFTI